jgi:transcriptional regulator with XRE-family HTH domain
MSIGGHIQSWRLFRRYSVDALAEKTHLPAATLEAIESGDTDPSAGTVERVANALGVPPSWLYTDPTHLDLLFSDGGDEPESPPFDHADPVAQRILFAARQERDLYVLLTTLLQSGDPKLIRAAEVSLRSLVKQSKQATVPWQARPPGHFEPPSD